MYEKKTLHNSIRKSDLFFSKKSFLTSFFEITDKTKNSLLFTQKQIQMPLMLLIIIIMNIIIININNKQNNIFFLLIIILIINYYYYYYYYRRKSNSSFN